MPQDISTTCNGFGNMFLIKHALSYPKSGLVLARHYYTEKEWGALGYRALFPSAMTYKPKINSRTVQGESNGTGARQESGTTEGGADIVEESQGGSGPTVNRADILVGRPGQVQVPE